MIKNPCIYSLWTENRILCC